MKSLAVIACSGVAGFLGGLLGAYSLFVLAMVAPTAVTAHTRRLENMHRDAKALGRMLVRHGDTIILCIVYVAVVTWTAANCLFYRARRERFMHY